MTNLFYALRIALGKRRYKKEGGGFKNCSLTWLWGGWTVGVKDRYDHGQHGFCRGGYR